MEHDAEWETLDSTRQAFGPISKSIVVAVTRPQA